MGMDGEERHGQVWLAACSCESLGVRGRVENVRRASLTAVEAFLSSFCPGFPSRVSRALAPKPAVLRRSIDGRGGGPGTSGPGFNYEYE